MTKLIVSEKGNVARRIANILSGGKAKLKESGKIPVYVFNDNSDEIRCFGLKGHLLKVDFPDQYSDWQKVEPVKLVDAPIVKKPVQKGMLKALQKEAKDVDEVWIACDFDREGELIGVDAVNKIKEVNPEVVVRRARFSSLTPEDIEKAFGNLEEIYVSLAQAGEARQDIDLVWGATLTRFISLATTRLGNQFLSVGRVQSPTLVLIAEREKERQAHVPKPYWQIAGLFRREGEEFVAPHKIDKFWKKEEAEEVLAKLGKEALVEKLAKTKRKSSPPAPFNTTSFLAAASQIGISPAYAMRLAENLYNQGFISYPRVDNTVYPKTLDFRRLLQALEPSPELGSLAGELLKQAQFTPTRGKKEATDHPPIHPTGLARKDELNAREWKIYELVCRRFFATLSTPAVIESVRVEIEANGELFILNGGTVAKEGYLKFYHYGRKKDKEIPALQEKEKLELVRVNLEEKETQPPPRYSQSKLLQEMEKLGLGTKSTRHSIIQNLYYREYIRENPIKPSETGMKVAEALTKHAERISSPEMTAEMEKDMDRIAEGKLDQGEVVERSRGVLADVMLVLAGKKQELAEEIREGIREDRAKSRLIGDCPACSGQLKVVTSKATKKRFVGCSGYPDCDKSYPLPQRGKITTLNKNCEECGSPKIKVASPRKKGGMSYWTLCIDPKCSTKDKKKTEGSKKKKTTRT